MNCQICHERPSTIHITEIEAGEPTVMHVCAQCAHEQDLVPNAASASPTLLSLLQNLVSQEFKAKSLSTEVLPGIPDLDALFAEETTRACPTCGITLKEFRQSGRFGCPDDYTTFRTEVVELVERIHGATAHVGVAPAGSDRRAQRRAQLTRMRAQLEDAIAREAYEDAARVRDEIQQLEAELGSGFHLEPDTADAPMASEAPDDAERDTGTSDGGGPAAD